MAEKSTKNDERLLLSRVLIDPPLKGDLFSAPGYALLGWAGDNRFSGKLLIEAHGRKDEAQLIEGIATGENTAKLELTLLRIAGAFHGTYTLVPTHVSAKEHAYPLAVLLKRLEEIIFRGKDTLAVHIDAPEMSSISDDGIAPVLSGLVRKRFTGRLFVERRESRKLLHWKQGMIISIASSDPTETLLIVLRRWNYLPTETISTLERKLAKTEMRLRDAIRTEELLKESLLTEAMRALHAERILELLSWRSGALRIRLEERAPSSKRSDPSISKDVVLARLLPDGRVGEMTSNTPTDQPFVLVVTEGVTTEEEIAEALRQASGKRVSGFYFRSSPQK